MGELNIKNADTHDTPSSGYTKLYPKTDGKFYVKDDAGVEVALGADALSLDSVPLDIADLTNGAKLYYDEASDEWKNEPLPLLTYGALITADWAPTWAQLYANGPVILAYPSTGPITITLPAPSGLPEDGMLRRAWVGNFGGLYSVKVVIAGGGTFVDGLSQLWVDGNGTAVHLGAVNGAVADTWMRISTLRNVLQIRRAATWAAANFSSATPLPFATQDFEGNPYIMDWASEIPSRLSAVLGGTYWIAGFANIDSTGGVTWNVACWLRKNGTTEIPGTRLRGGNYGGEDDSVTLPQTRVSLAAGDYLEWVFQQTGLTGTLYSATMSSEILV